MPLFGRSGSPNVKRLRQSRDVEGLLAALTDPTDQIRQAAADALGNLRDVRALDPLLTALHDPAFGVQEAAAGALGNLGDARAVDPLLQFILQSQARDLLLFAAVAKALGQIEAARAVEVLITVLTDQGSTKQKAGNAASALIFLAGDVRVVERLQASPQNEAHRDTVRKAAAEHWKNPRDALRASIAYPFNRR